MKHWIFMLVWVTLSGSVAGCNKDKKTSQTDFVCGNGVKEGSEECDGEDVGEATCASLGFDGGTLQCTNACQLDRSGCERRSCEVETQQADCDDGLPCTDDLCDAERHTCIHPFKPNTHVCRPAAGDCDLAERCTGSSAECPVDEFAPVGTACDDGNACTTDDQCNAEALCTGTITSYLSDLTAVAAAGGSAHTCALTTSGGVKCWGKNDNGQLGDGTWTDRHTPVDVDGLTSGVSAIAAGEYHTCALTTSGGVKCWGNNLYKQLGDGTWENRNTPVDVVGLTSGVSAVAAGWNHTCALTTSGGVKCWGANFSGQLGDGTTTDSETPVDVVGLTSGVSAVAAGSVHTCALTTSQEVKCWGKNDYGQLGDGTTTDSETPVDVVGLTWGVSAVAAGSVHTCALTVNQGVKCWGNNFSGQLGEGTTLSYSHTPVNVVGLTSGVSAVAAGSAHTCALTTSQGVKCWGRNNHGQLGDGTTTERNTPVDVVGLTSGVSAVAAGYFHTCALTTSGGVTCWGRNLEGQLGDGTTTDRHRVECN